MIRPTKKSLIITAGLVLALWAAPFLGIWFIELKQTILQLSYFLTFLFVAAIFADLFTIRPAYDVSLDIPDKVPLGVWRPCRWQGDGINDRIELKVMHPSAMQVEYQSNQGLHFKFTERGSFTFSGYVMRVTSLFGLLQRNFQLNQEKTIKVFPNYSHLQRYNLSLTEQLSSDSGINKQPKRGEGTEFHQLRDYQFGDSLRKVDWNHSALLNKLISKEYQEERNQNIVLLLDNGRRMRAIDGEFSFFDHCLNTAILLGQIALEQGDAVGMMSFGGTDRYVAPKSGKPQLSQILNTSFDLQPSKEVSDYLTMATTLSQRLKKRSLIILLTNFRDDQDSELQQAMSLLRKRHLLLIGDLQEEALFRDIEINDNVNALTYAAQQQLKNQRTQLQNQLKELGLWVMDSKPEALPANIINSYNAIKKAGYL